MMVNDIYAALTNRSFNMASAVYSSYMDLALRDTDLEVADVFDGKSVLEIGAGKFPLFPAFALVLGAALIKSVDIERQRSRFFKYVFKKSDLSYRFLSALLDESQYRTQVMERLRLLIRDPGNFLREDDNYHYSAPFDLASLEANFFDTGFTYTVLEHVEKHEIEKFAKDYFRSLRPGGVAIDIIDFIDHNTGILDPFVIWDDPRLTFDRSENVSGLTLAEIKSAFEGAGFEVLSEWLYTGEPRFNNRGINRPGALTAVLVHKKSIEV